MYVILNHSHLSILSFLLIILPFSKTIVCYQKFPGDSVRLVMGDNCGIGFTNKWHFVHKTHQPYTISDDKQWLKNAVVAQAKKPEKDLSKPWLTNLKYQELSDRAEVIYTTNLLVGVKEIAEAQDDIDDIVVPDQYLAIAVGNSEADFKKTGRWRVIASR